MAAISWLTQKRMREETARNMARRGWNQQQTPTTVAQQPPSLIQSFQNDLAEARKANEARFNEAMQRIQGQGETERGDIGQRYSQLGAQATQGLISSGLSGSTVAPTMQMGIERAKTRELGALDERLNNQYINLLQSKEDVYPDLGMLMQLQQGAGAGSFNYQPRSGQLNMNNINAAIGGSRNTVLDNYNRMRQERLAREAMQMRTGGQYAPPGTLSQTPYLPGGAAMYINGQTVMPNTSDYRNMDYSTPSELGADPNLSLSQIRERYNR